MAGVTEPRILVLNMHGREHYLIYSKTRMLHCVEFCYRPYAVDKKYLFSVDFAPDKRKAARFCEIDYAVLAFRYEELVYEPLLAYCLSEQPIEAGWLPAWGKPVVQTDVYYSSIVMPKVTDHGVMCEFFDSGEDVEDSNPENAMFIPFDHQYPPAEKFVGCEVDGTFFLLFNHVELPRA